MPNDTRHPPPPMVAEVQRLEALRRYEILDTPQEAEFDDFARLASHICGTPIAMISFVDGDRQWFKSEIGTNLGGTPRDEAFCDHAIRRAEVFVVQDASEDERFRDNPLVTGDPEVRFYAGAPLATPDGHNVGTLCVLDRVPRSLSDGQREALSLLSRQLVSLLEARYTARAHATQSAFLEAVLDGASLAVLSMTPDGTITSLNPAAERMLGYSARELIGVSSIDALHDPTEAEDYARELGREPTPAVEPEVHPVLRGVARGRGVEREWTYVRRDGTRLPVSILVTQVGGGDAPASFVALARDLTEEKRLQRVESEAKERLTLKSWRLESILTGTNVGTWEWNVQTGETVFNERWADIIGYTLDELGPISIDTWMRFAHPDDLERSNELLQRHFRGEDDFYHFESRMRHKDGSWVWVLDRGKVFSWTEDGQPSMMFGTHQDITERKLAEEELRRSRQRFAALFQADPVASCLSDLDTGEIIDVNPQFLELFGRSRESVVGRNSVDLGFWGGEGVDRAVLARELATHGTVRDIERQVVPADGRPVWVSAAARVVEMDDRRAVLSTFVDITTRKEAEDEVRRLNVRLSDLVHERTVELRATEERLQLLAENSDDVFWFVSVDRGAFTYVSPAVERVWGVSLEELYDDPGAWMDAIHPQDRDRVERAYSACLANESIGYSEEYRVVAADGVVRWVHDSATVIRDGQGSPRTISGVARDISDRKKREGLARRSQRLEAIGTLAGGVAHDLNNALAPILMGVQMLRSERPDESELIDTFESSARRAAGMTRQLLAFARGADGERVPVQARHLLTEMRDIVRATFPKDIEARFSHSDDLPAIIGDPTQIHQVLLNLCVNARDAMPNGGSLTVQAQRRSVDDGYAKLSPQAEPGTYLEFDVRDTGVGMSPEIIERIFDPFFTTKDPERGTGLGLSTVLSIVESHGGTLNVYSEPGVGTTFRVLLPAEPSASGDGEATGESPVLRGNGEIVLVVDDEVTVRRVASAVLTKAGFRVRTATNGLEALSKIADMEDAPAAVLTDVHMPRMGGLAFVEELSRDRPDVPVAVMSGMLDAATARGFRACGVEVLLDKPFSENDLALALGPLLRPRGITESVHGQDGQALAREEG